MRLSKMPLLSIMTGFGAAIGGGTVFKWSAATGMALAFPVLKGMLVGAVAGFVLWMALRIFLLTEL